METTMQKETLGFQAEVKQLLRLMVHSLYSNKEIFLRELISNASDAADKLRFEALHQGNLWENDSELRIEVRFDRDAGTLTLRDNGIGMSRQEVIDNIGTIAKSGTKAFLDSLTGDQKQDANLIGQFGVGFYSGFIVADRVTIETRRAGLGADQGVRWESAGDGEYSIETITKASRGTDIILHLREGETELLDAWRLKHIIRKYSDHITIPIRMQKSPSFDSEGKEIPATEDETVNQANALWARPKAEISDEEYQSFYKHVSHAFDEALAWSHAKVEGRQTYTELLYIPTQAPFDLYDRERRHGIKLYVQRVFIMDEAEKLLPQYLRFVRGVVDAADLPLNVSREILQHSKDLDAIRAGCTKKVLSLLEDLASNRSEDYRKFWQAFGNVLKEGVGEDHSNRERVAGLCRFASTQSDSSDAVVSLDDYISRMKEGQEALYYITADSYAAAKNSPHLEIFRKKGIEVLLLTDRVDEWVVSSLPEFKGKKLQSISKGELDLGNLNDAEEAAQVEQDAATLSSLTEALQKELGSKVKAVRITHRLTDSAACLVTENHDISTHLERLLKAAGQDVPNTQPILEINPQHPLTQRLREQEGNANFGELSSLLFDQALLAEGGQLDDPAGFVKRLNKLLLGQ